MQLNKEVISASMESNISDRSAHSHDSSNGNHTPKQARQRAKDSEVNLHKFLKGFQRFHQNYFAENKNLFDTLQNGQAPKTCLIGCCDSRVDPAIITDCDPGDIFVIRNVANLVAPYSADSGHHGTASAIEYAIKVLQVENVVVLGHSKCGGIQALMTEQTGDLEFVGPWMSIARKAKEKTLKYVDYRNLTLATRYYADRPFHVQLKACEHASILQSLENLVSYPWIHSRLNDGSLSLTGWYFDFETGDLLAYSAETSTFEPLALGPTPAKKNSVVLNGVDDEEVNIPQITIEEHLSAVQN